MRKLTRTIAVAAALGLVAPALAQDAKDTVTEKKADASRTAREHKPGGETAADKAKDAQDAAKSTTAKTKKKARKAGRHAKQRIHEKTRATDTTEPAPQR